MSLATFVTDSRRLVYVLGGAIALMVFITVIFVVSSFGSKQSSEAELEVWGVFDDTVTMDQALKDFEKANKGITVKYRMLPFAGYEQALLNALAAGTGPDVFMIHHTWLPKHIDKIQPMPSGDAPLMTIRQFKELFVDVAAADLINDNKIYALPLYVDTLALYYNKDLFASAGITKPPGTWLEFMESVELLTKKDSSENILTSAAAIGSAQNINRATDILMMLMLQSGVRMTNDSSSQASFAKSVDGQPVGEVALTFYTDFTNPQKEVYTWNDTQDYSIDAFTAGKTAMMFNYSHQIPAVRSKAPRLNFAIAPAPQANGQASLTDRRTYANYWPLTVSLASDHPYEAWQFVHYMTAGPGTVSYLNESNRPAARKDIIQQQKNDPDLGVFAEQALTARSWFQIDNQAIEAIFATMIENVNFGRQSIRDALKEAEAKVTVLMSR